MSNTFKFQVVAPDKPAIAEDATSVVLPGEMGEFGVLAHHMAFLSILKPGTLRVVKGNGRELYFVAGGFAEVNQASVIVLAEDYEKAEEIDMEEAQKAKSQAQEQLSEKKEGTDLEALRHTLARAEARLKTAEEAKALKK
jgi:F-type H+-transporting ATPase subunit epsilon